MFPCSGFSFEAAKVNPIAKNLATFFLGSGLCCPNQYAGMRRSMTMQNMVASFDRSSPSRNNPATPYSYRTLVVSGLSSPAYAACRHHVPSYHLLSHYISNLKGAHAHPGVHSVPIRPSDGCHARTMEGKTWTEQQHPARKKVGRHHVSSRGGISCSDGYGG
jgi:hypothetical protein